MLRPIWRSTGLSIHTKIRIFKSNVLSVLLYGSECWKSTTSIERKREVFQNKCLRRILKTYWPNTISNEDLRIRTATTPIQEAIQTRRLEMAGTRMSHAINYSSKNSATMDTPREKKSWAAKRNMAKDIRKRAEEQGT